MRLHVARNAAVGEQADTITEVGSIAYGVLDGKLRSEPHGIHAVDAPPVQRSLEVGAPETTVAIGRHHDLVRRRLEARERRGAPGAALERAKRFGLQEQAAVAQQVGIIRRKGDEDMRNRPAGAPRFIECALTGGEEIRRLGRAAVEREWDESIGMADVVLIVQRQQRVAHEPLFLCARASSSVAPRPALAFRELYPSILTF